MKLSDDFVTELQIIEVRSPKKKLDQPVAAHFNQPGHVVSDLLSIAIERVLPLNNTTLRRQREHLWIDRTDSTTYGANRRE